MIKKIMLLLCFGLILSACTDNDTLYSPELDESSYKAESSEFVKHTKMVPQPLKTKTKKLKIKGQGTIQYLPEIGECGVGESLTIAQGTGKSNILGKFTLFLSYCIEEDCDNTTPPTGYHISSKGDTLYSTFQYADFEEDGRFFQVYDYHGGTGEFINATGSIKLYFELDTYTCPNVYTNYGVGTLTY